MTQKKAEPIDWQRTCMRLLECFGCYEGVWYEENWEEFGITAEDRAAIIAAYGKWLRGKLK